MSISEQGIVQGIDGIERSNTRHHPALVVVVGYARIYPIFALTSGTT